MLPVLLVFVSASVHQQTGDLSVPVHGCKKESRLTMPIAHVLVSPSVHQQTDNFRVALPCCNYESSTIVVLVSTHLKHTLRCFNTAFLGSVGHKLFSSLALLLLVASINRQHQLQIGGCTDFVVIFQAGTIIYQPLQADQHQLQIGGCSDFVVIFQAGTIIYQPLQADREAVSLLANDTSSPEHGTAPQRQGLAHRQKPIKSAALQEPLRK